MTKPEQPPEGALIARARGSLSARGAAVRAGISEGRWRQLEAGFSSAGRGQYVVQVAPADTLARMARAVGVTAEQLSEVGRDDAAEVLARITPPAGVRDLEVGWFDELRDIPDEVLAAEVARRLLADHLPQGNAAETSVMIHEALTPLFTRNKSGLATSTAERRWAAQGASDMPHAARTGQVRESPAAVHQRAAGEENQDPGGETLD